MPNALRDERLKDRRVLWIAAAVYAALSAWMAVASHGFLEADGITHYLARRFALTQPLHLVSIWSRPLCVAMYAPISYATGLIGTRLESLALVLAMTGLTVAIARRLGLKRPAWAGLLLLTQPLLFAHSFSELTEVPFALLLAAAFYAYQRKWFGVMAALIAVAPLGRPEGFGLLLVAAVALVLHRRWAWLALLPAGLAVWSYAGWVAFGRAESYPWWRWLPENWPYSPDSVYGHGSVFKFLLILPSITGPIAFGFAAFGVVALLRVGRPLLAAARSFMTGHCERCRVLVVLIPIGVLLIHSLLWATGKMASNGEPRYLLVAAPFWAIISAAGLERLTRRYAWRRPLALVLINAALPVAFNLSYPCFPLGMQDDDRLATAVGVWMRDHDDYRERYPLLYTWMPHMYLQLDVDKLDPHMGGQPTKAQARSPKPGTIMVWDSTYSVFNSSADYVVPESVLAEGGWRQVWETSVGGHTAKIFVSPQDNSGLPPVPSPGTPGEG